MRTHILRTERSSSDRAFTLVELLVVIGIIGLLIGLILPAVANAHNSAEKTRELHKLRQLAGAWQVYADYSENRVLPGFLHPDVQQAWGVKYRERYHNTVIDPEYAAPYTWRLLPYLGDQHVILHDYAHEEDDDPTEELNEIAYEPAFGYNAIYLGGWFEGIEPNRRPIVRFEAANVIARTMAQIDRPTTTVVFASSGERQAGVAFSQVVDNAPGSHFVVPPIIAQTRQWENRGNAINVLQTNSVPIMRYTEQVALLFADGHTGAEGAGSLNDQRRWIVTADDPAYIHAP